MEADLSRIKVALAVMSSAELEALIEATNRPRYSGWVWVDSR